MWSAIRKKASRNGLTSASAALSCQLTTSSSSHGDAARSLIAMRTPPPSGHAGLRFAVEVVEDVGPVDGDRVFVLEDDAHHAPERGTAVRALCLGLLVVVLDPEHSHAEPKGSRWDRGCELST